MKVGGTVPSLAADPEAGFDPDAALAPKDQRKVAAEEALAQARWAPASETDRLRTATIIAPGIGARIPAGFLTGSHNAHAAKPAGHAGEIPVNQIPAMTALLKIAFLQSLSPFGR